MIVVIHSNSVEARARTRSSPMSKQTSVELPDMNAEHGLGKSIVVKRKRGRPAQQKEANLDAEHNVENSSGVERKWSRLGEVLTLEDLLKEDVGWFTIKPPVTIVALSTRRYYYHRCVACGGKKGIQNTEGKYGCIEHPEARINQTYRLRVLIRQGDLNMWVTAFGEVAESILGVSVERFNDDGRKRVAWGVSGMKCNITIEKKQHNIYTNYTLESKKPLGISIEL